MTKHDDDLTPWSESGGPALMREATRAYRADGPSDDALGVMLASVQAAPLVPTPHFDASPLLGKASAPLLGKAAGAAWTTKIGAAVVLATTVTVGGVKLMPNAHEPRERRAPTVSVERAHAAHPVIESPVTQAASAPVSDEPLDLTVVPASSAVRGNSAVPVVPRERPHRTLAKREPVQQEPTVRPERPAVDELLLIRRAFGALENDPATTLRLVSEHRQSHPEGALSEERDVLGIEALVALGRRSEAEGMARSFRAKHPASLHLRRIDVILSATH